MSPRMLKCQIRPHIGPHALSGTHQLSANFQGRATLKSFQDIANFQKGMCCVVISIDSSVDCSVKADAVTNQNFLFVLNANFGKIGSVK